MEGRAVSPPLRRPSDLVKDGERRTGRGRETLPSNAPIGRWPEHFATAGQDRQALLVLSQLASLTARRLLALATRCGTASECLAAVRRGEAGSEADRRLAARLDGKEVARCLAAGEIELLAVHDEGYPRCLLDLFDPPAALFVRGQPPQGLTPAVAVVGARNCSPTGRDIAHALGGALAQAGACVASGGARGIDMAAHLGALDSGGSTIIVMGCGIDVPYPRQNKRLHERAIDTGALVSEYPPGTPAEPFRFPARNRIIAALSRAVVVVEGAAGSGSLITADHALEIGRDVFAVPGATSNPLSHAPLTLIREGAAVIRGPDDLLADLGMLAHSGREGAPSQIGGQPGSVPGRAGATLSPAQRSVWSALTTPSPPDVLAARAGLPLPQVLSALLEMELRGIVREAGGRFERRYQGSRATA